MQDEVNKDSQKSKHVQMPQGYFVPVSSVPDNVEINFSDLWKILIDKKKMIIVIALTITAMAIVLALIMTPIYRAETILAPVDKQRGSRLGALASQFGGLASLAGIDLRSGGDSNEAIATLLSRDFTNSFITSENLLPILFEKKWNSERMEWNNTEDIPTLWDAYNKFDKSIRTLSIDKKTGLITLGIEWKNPEEAAEWATKLVDRINSQLRNEAILEAEKSIQYLENELLKTSVLEVKQSIYNLIEAQTKNKMLASTEQEYAFHVIDKAVIPEEKIRPKRKLIVIVGFLLGIIVGVFTVIIRRGLNASASIAR